MSRFDMVAVLVLKPDPTDGPGLEFVSYLRGEWVRHWQDQSGTKPKREESRWIPSTIFMRV